MMPWTPEAEKRLESYLEEVLLLARSRGDAEPDFADDLQLHIRRDAEERASGLVTLQHLERALASAGTPQDVLGVEAVASVLAGAADRPLAAATAPFAEAPARFSGSNAPAGYAPAPQRNSRVNLGMKTCLLVMLCILLLPFVFAVFGMLAAIVLPAFSRSREAARRAGCQTNLKQAAVALAHYADAHEGAFPPLANGHGALTFGDELGPRPGLAWLQCPSDRSGADGSIPDYIYLGYAVRSQEELDALVAALVKKQTTQDGSIAGAQDDLDPISSGLSDPAAIPVLVEWDDLHIPRGGNVLFLDGHVKFIKFPGEFPMTTEFFDAIRRVRPEGHAARTLP